MKKLKWAALKRHIALPLVLVAVLFIIAALVQVRGAKEQGTYKAIHLYGDDSVMAGITISGAIVDANHKTSFIWQDAQVETETEVYTKSRSDWQYHSYARFYPWYYPINDYYYRVNDRLIHEGISVERNNSSNNTWEQSEYAAVDIPVQRLFKKGNNVTEYTNTRTYGLAEAAGDLYFTLVTTERYKGTNGIYKLNFDTWEYLPSAIMTYSLDSNSQEEGTRIAVLGLEAVGDKLALILVKDNALVIEGYRTDGVKLGEAVIAPFLFESANAEFTGEETSVRHHEAYEAYSQAENGMLSLSFNNNDGQRTVVTVQCSEAGIAFVDMTEIGKEDKQLRENSEYVQGERFITYKDGKLYYVGVFREYLDQEGYVWDMMLPIRLLINVYEQGTIVYTGELLTDVNDDLLRVNQYDLYNFDFDRSEYRNFFDLYIN